MDVTQGKVYNGYGMKTSKLSVTNIGQYNLESEATTKRENAQRAHMIIAAKQEIENSKTNHASRMNLHMQKHYPDTLSRLQHGDLTRLKTPPDLKQFTWNKPFSRAEQTNIVDLATTKRTVDTAHWNQCKRVYNLEKSNKAEVNQIICGEGKVRDKYPLFPAKATHNQLLAIDGKVSGEPAHIPAPEPKPQLRWLGESLGWEKNRGLSATRKEFEDGRIDKWPNPKNWNRNPGPLFG
ncbi:hypothetical protein TL16_g00093 [Triparma laevis f. inornata]|uniref:Uncharacterized protein n=2 Tax=Triparma laevis TaxID=1534972 RepID=A0A9W7CJU1_9STRA|nr:hypothetical protein TL16_g00093 [Triparma laevis f. inornata]GMI07521.1 hypothetical protein TrLO_g8240 [Triparma laevis f. longispina]